MDASSILFVCCNPERLVFGTSKELFTLFYFIHLSRRMQKLYILCLTEAVQRDSLFQNLVSQCFQIGTSKWMPPFQQSRETYAHIMSVEKYGYSLDSLHHLFRSLIVPILLMAFQYGMLLVMISIFPKQASFKKEQFVQVFLPILSLLEASDNRLWKSITTATEDPLVNILPPTVKQDC